MNRNTGILSHMNVSLAIGFQMSPVLNEKKNKRSKPAIVYEN